MSAAERGMRRRVRVRVLLLATCVAWAAGGVATAEAAYQRPGAFRLVSAGFPPGWSAYSGAVSLGGEVVAFRADGCSSPEGCGWAQVYVRRGAAAAELVTVGVDGQPGDRPTNFRPLVTPDGRFVAFSSSATNLVAGDTNDATDGFVRDVVAGTTERVTLSDTGEQADGGGVVFAISSDGRFVGFQSSATDLVAGDTNGVTDVFVRDRWAGTTERVSLAHDGAEANGPSAGAAMSADGRFVVFSSPATNLVPGDTNDNADIFVRDRERGTTERVSVTSGGAQAACRGVRTPVIFIGDPGIWHPVAAVSDDGRYVAFHFCDSNLVWGDFNGVADIFVRDRLAGTTELVTIGSDGTRGREGCLLTVPGMSGDGRFVAFTCPSTNGHLVGHNPNTGADVFVRDRLLGTTEVASPVPEGETFAGSLGTSLSADGRHVAFTSQFPFTGEDEDPFTDVYVRDRGPDLGVLGLDASLAGGVLAAWGQASFSGVELTAASDEVDELGPAGDALGADISGARLLARAVEEDLAVRIRVNALPDAGPRPGILYGLSFTADGVRYEVRGHGFPGPPASDEPRFALFTCALTCVEQARLRGAVGLTGPEAVVSIPLALLPEAQQLTAIRAFTAIGDVSTGSPALLDEVLLPDATIDRPHIQIGIVPAGTPAQDVVYSETVPNDAGRFSAAIPVPEGQWWVYARACHQTCSEPTIASLS